ncbi:MAG: hypothetical protein WC549_09660 [Actinomycetota bacterium]
MSKLDEIIKDLNIQEEIQGGQDFEDIAIVRQFLDTHPSRLQWEAMVKVSNYRYGRLSYEVYRFYYPTPQLRALCSN